MQPVIEGVEKFTWGLWLGYFGAALEDDNWVSLEMYLEGDDDTNLQAMIA